ncbi:MAG TPA: tetratricopeptide repeat protein [Tepidisphaeraceae bacterium]|jgi:tetratricopeptide (TPR) repeat protein|nr:tetratricopeptide repeat protein [Tepidisphaeraceae bacterium]
MKYRSLLAVAVLSGVASLGCAKNPATANNTASVAARPNPTDFDVAKEPAITANTRYAAGQLAESDKSYDNAIAQYKFALESNPKHLKSLYRLGCLYAQLQRYPEAVEAWKRYVIATDGSATGYSNLGFCEELAGNPNAAEADYKRGIAKDPGNEPCRVNYGLMLARRGRTGEAVVQLQTVLTPAQVHYNLASVYELQHRKAQAKQEYQKSLELDPNFDDAKAKLASLN